MGGQSTRAVACRSRLGGASTYYLFLQPLDSRNFSSLSAVRPCRSMRSFSLPLSSRMTRSGLWCEIHFTAMARHTRGARNERARRFGQQKRQESERETGASAGSLAFWALSLTLDVLPLLPPFLLLKVPAHLRVRRVVQPSGGAALEPRLRAGLEVLRVGLHDVAVARLGRAVSERDGDDAVARGRLLGLLGGADHQRGEEEPDRHCFWGSWRFSFRSHRRAGRQGGYTGSLGGSAAFDRLVCHHSAIRFLQSATTAHVEEPNTRMLIL